MSTTDSITPALARAAHPRPSGISIRRFFTMHARAVIFPLTAGLAISGWRAATVVGVICLCTLLATFIWRHIGRRGIQLRYSHMLWLALLLSLTLPAHLAGPSLHIWPILPAAGMLLAMFTWLLGGVGASRIHPVLITHLLLVAIFGGGGFEGLSRYIDREPRPSLLDPYAVLRRDRLFTGDLLSLETAAQTTTTGRRWISQPLPDSSLDSLSREPARRKLGAFTRAQPSERSGLSLAAIIRDTMPAMEDLVIGGEPSPIGTTSTIAVIVGGLFLLYHGLIDVRIPLFIVIAAYFSLLMLPVPVIITDTRVSWICILPEWFRTGPEQIGIALGLTFANYEILCSPLLLMSFFLATAPSLRPMSRRARVLYALLIGVITALLQLYTSIAIGPYLALLIVSLLTPLMDRYISPRTLV